MEPANGRVLMTAASMIYWRYKLKLRCHWVAPLNCRSRDCKRTEPRPRLAPKPTTYIYAVCMQTIKFPTRGFKRPSPTCNKQLILTQVLYVLMKNWRVLICCRRYSGPYRRIPDSPRYETTRSGY